MGCSNPPVHPPLDPPAAASNQPAAGQSVSIAASTVVAGASPVNQPAVSSTGTAVSTGAATPPALPVFTASRPAPTAAIQPSPIIMASKDHSASKGTTTNYSSSYSYSTTGAGTYDAVAAAASPAGYSAVGQSASYDSYSQSLARRPSTGSAFTKVCTARVTYCWCMGQESAVDQCHPVLVNAYDCTICRVLRCQPGAAAGIDAVTKPGCLLHR